MSRKTFYLVLLLLLPMMGSAQRDTLVKNAVYIEALGIGGLGSINYEHFVFEKNRFIIGVRLGLSTYRITDFRNKFNPDVIIPISVNFLYGTKHKLEIGLGNTYTNTVHAGLDLSPERETAIHGNAYIGYRLQFLTKKPILKNINGFVIRIGYSPLFEYFRSVRHWGGLSFGITF